MDTNDSTKTTPAATGATNAVIVWRVLLFLVVVFFVVSLLISLSLYFAGGQGEAHAFAYLAVLGVCLVGCAGALDLAATITGKTSTTRSVVYGSLRMVGTMISVIGALITLGKL